jgi:tRNA (mo5U34)-methyltransferase
MPLAPDEAAKLVAALDWYHTIDLGDGLVTPGAYDHRPCLTRYRLPDDLRGQRALDVGAASGFFSFELERRGAQVVATDLPAWFEHDFGPTYQPDQDSDSGQRYLHEPFEVARRALGSRVVKRELNIYDLTPETLGEFDLVFCGSLLIHLTDPIRALWRLADVTRPDGQAIIATVIAHAHADEPLALLTGQNHGDTWWAPTRAALELLVALAGFEAIEWVSDFALDLRDGSPGPYHGVVHAWRSLTHAPASATPAAEILARRPPPQPDYPAQLRQRDARIAELEALVRGYEAGRVMRAMRWVGERSRRDGRGV